MRGSLKQLAAGVVLSLVSLAVLLIAIPQLVDRLSGREGLGDRPVFWFGEAFPFGSFRYAGHELQLTRVDPDQVPGDLLATDPGLATGFVELTWRGVITRIPYPPEEQRAIGPPSDADTRLPGMTAHERWFRLMPLAEVEGVSGRDELIELIAAGEVTPRLIAAARYPAEGYDPDSWGLVRRKEWPYVFYELLVDGPPAESIRITRATYGELEAIYAPGPYDDPVDLSPEEKRAGLWRHDAMLQVTPSPLYRSKDKIVEEGILAMGWTWPAAAGAAAGLLLGLTLIAASRVDPASVEQRAHVIGRATQQ
ncbi:MAG: hypothetical protein AAGI30_11255 [Planctomycetota bacterium]